MHTTLPNQIIIPEHALFQEVEEEAVILNLQNEHYFGLNPVAREIWLQLAEHGDSERALTALLQRYQVEESRLRSDIAQLLNELAAEGLIRLPDSSAR